LAHDTHSRDPGGKRLAADRAAADAAASGSQSAVSHRDADSAACAWSSALEQAGNDPAALADSSSVKRRRRRLARRNPESTASTVLTIGGLAGVASAVLGQPQLGGALLLGSGTYGLVKGSGTQRIVGGLYDIIGFGMVVVRR